MKKKQTLLFLLFSLALIVVLALCLIFVLKADDDTDNNLTKNSQSAQSFKLVSDDTIYMDINSTIEVLDSFFNVSNVSLDTLTCEVCSYYGSDVSGLTYNNRKLTASMADSYKLKFCLEVNDKAVSHEVKIVVEDSALITQKETRVNVNENYNINTLFNIDSELSGVVFGNSDFYTVKNSNFNATKTGKASVNISYTNKGIKHNYIFNVQILSVPEYIIKAENIEAVQSDEFCYIHFEVLDKNLSNNNINQEVLIEIENSGVVEFIDATAPIITLKINGVGQTRAKLTMKNNKDITNVISITIKN